MARLRVYLDELVDTAEVAAILGLSRSNNVSMYRARYPAFPAPVLDSGPGHPAWWVRADIERWNADRGPVRRNPA